jgi:hypothetical protein
MNSRQSLLALGAAVALALSQGAIAQEPTRAYDKTFLTNYDLLKPRSGVAGQPGDLAYVAPGAIKRLTAYKGVMVDQPEILFSADSEIKGMKPDDLRELSEALRDALAGGLASGGYSVLQQPGPGVLYVRVALTDVIVKKKKRALLAYTPAGAIIKAGADVLREAFDKVDFIETTFQVELVDSVSNDVLGALVAPRGQRKAEGQKETRIDMGDMRQDMLAWSNRLRCLLDNTKLPADKQNVCNDDAANFGRYGKS